MKEKETKEKLIKELYFFADELEGIRNLNTLVIAEELRDCAMTIELAWKVESST